MKLKLFLPAVALLASIANADVIVTKDGSTLNGTVVGIDGGKITFATEYAGELKLDQSLVESITTDEPIYLTLENGSTYVGPISGSGSALTVASENGTVSTEVSKVTESWQPGSESPSAKRQAARIKGLQRKWAYEAAFDLTGKSGNSESTGLGASFRATLKGDKDKLQFFAKANFEDTDGVKSADDARGGVDYSNKFGKSYNWYVRSEFGYDAVKDIEQMYTVAAGFGYIFSDNETRSLSVRGGLGYLYESYDDLFDPVTETFSTREQTSSASLDLGLEHREVLKWGTWVNRATFTPTIDDFGNFRFVYDSSVDLPIKVDGWSVRAGVNFDYDSEADLSNKEELDTTYYVRMVLKWL